MSWKNGLVDWVEGNTAFISVVFSWLLPQAYSKCVWYSQQGYRVRAGGPAVTMNPDYLSQVAEIGGDVEALIHHNADAIYTTRGCVRSCKFCAVPKIEGKLIELPDSLWQPKRIICDNNLLGASEEYFDHVIDRLKKSGIRGIDFNGGLDARLLTWHHAQRLSELPGAIFHLAWDNVRLEAEFLQAVEFLLHYGIAKNRIRIYVLIGYDDTPHEALYRLAKIKCMGMMPNPMRYQPLNTLKKNSYISPNWTDAELKKFMRYWARQSFFRGIDFSEYSPHTHRATIEQEGFYD